MYIVKPSNSYVDAYADKILVKGRLASKTSDVSDILSASVLGI